MLPWKQKAQGFDAQGITPAFWTLVAPSKENVLVHVEVGSNSTTLSLNNCPISLYPFPPSDMWSLKSKMEITTGGSSLQIVSIFMRIVHIIVAPSPNQTTSKMFASFISEILLQSLIEDVHLKIAISDCHMSMWTTQCQHRTWQQKF